MKTKQSALAKKWGVSRSSICKYHKAGMPLDEVKAFAWLMQNIPVSKIHLNAEEALHPWQTAPETPAELEEKPDPREGNPNWRMTHDETIEAVKILLYLKNKGAHRAKHPEHQTFCNGLRMTLERGLDLLPEQWAQARGES